MLQNGTAVVAVLRAGTPGLAVHSLGTLSTTAACAASMVTKNLIDSILSIPYSVQVQYLYQKAPRTGYNYAILWVITISVLLSNNAQVRRSVHDNTRHVPVSGV